MAKLGEQGEGIKQKKKKNPTKNKTVASSSVSQLIRASSQYTKVVGSIHGQDTYKNQPINA